MPSGRSFDPDGEYRVSSPAGVWFRKGGRLAAGERRRQSKIHTESNQREFLGISGELSSMQTLAIYRRLLVRD
jgi:hypothetical protein